MKELHLNLYQKFISAMILGGIIPMFILSSVILNRMFKNYETSLLDSYEQSLDYVSGSVKNLFDTYDEVLKLLYNYEDNDVTVMSLNYDRANTIKGILDIKANEELSEAEAKRLKNTRMSSFVRYIAMTNADIAGAFFMDAKDNVYGHVTNSYFADDALLREAIDFRRIDRETKQMQFFPTHYNDYFKNKKDLVFSLSRNYFDLSGAVGKYKYLGSLFIEIDIASLERLFINTQIFTQGEVFILDEQNRCIYSNKQNLITQVLTEEQIRGGQEDSQLTTERILDNNWRIIYKVPYSMIFFQIKRAQKIMFGVLSISLIALILASSVFSKKMTAPIRAMISKMEAIENGDFSIEIPVRSKDELGLLS
ncbi:MAG: HAMP domain-containing protein, partial [Vallitaleaceae bacterium]|nr:HAMP domain-containing protein [Vallitaleaceae bacterium]